MKSPFQYRWFCFITSIMSAYFIYMDLSKDHKVNLINLLWFIGTTYLFFSHDKSSTTKKDLILENKEEENSSELKIMKTFKK